MSQVKVNIKWGKEKFNDIILHKDEPLDVFKAQVFALTNVPVERQKLMFKGAVVKDESLASLTIADGTTILLMGTAECLSMSNEKAVFVEDLTDAELAKALKLPSGLTNLGNTCYMNATVQCLRSVPELVTSAKLFSLRSAGVIDPSDSDMVVQSFRELLIVIEKSGHAISPLLFLGCLHRAFPQFAKQEQGKFIQQDASECWTTLLQTLKEKLAPLNTTGSAIFKNSIDQYFGISLTESTKCLEDDDDVQVTEVHELKLSCHIDKEIKYLHSGIKNRLCEELSKFSTKLGRDAKYTRESRISRLPAYLTLEFVRFFYKEQVAVNAKILRDVKFPLQLDLYEFSTSELQQRLLAQRDRFKAAEDERVEREVKQPKLKEPRTSADKTASKWSAVGSFEPFCFPDDPGSNNSGYYELQAVLTHQGRQSNSGHYVAWVRHKDDEWYMFDDDTVRIVLTDDVLKLSGGGGGDWHIAYICLYGPRRLERRAATIAAGDSSAAS